MKRQWNHHSYISPVGYKQYEADGEPRFLPVSVQGGSEDDSEVEVEGEDYSYSDSEGEGEGEGEQHDRQCW